MKRPRAAGSRAAPSGPWSIGEVARRAGLQSSAIRYYEAAGLLPAAERRNGRRIYDASVLARLGLIRLAQSAGFSIAEIRSLLHGFDRDAPPSLRWRTLAETKRAEIREQVRRARAMEGVLDRLLGCACPSLEVCGRAVAALADGPEAR